MSGNNKDPSYSRSMTLRISDPDIVSWMAAQSNITASIRMAIRMAIMEYGSGSDLPKELLTALYKEKNKGNSMADAAFHAGRNEGMPGNDAGSSSEKEKMPVPDAAEADTAGRAQPAESVQPVQRMQNTQMSNPVRNAGSIPSGLRGLLS